MVFCVTNLIGAFLNRSIFQLQRLSEDFLRDLFLSLSLMLTSGCTIVTVQGDAKVSRSYWFAPLRIEADTNAKVVVVSDEGLGIVSGWQGLTIGYKKEFLILLKDPEDCRTILLVDHSTDLDFLNRIFNPSDRSRLQLCPITLEDRK